MNLLKNVEIKIDISPDIPTCFGDYGHLMRVFVNLIDNAIKYTNPNRTGKISISGHYEKTGSVYHIKDNGIGFDKEHAEKIFEMFHRLEPEGDIKGEGIGLTIVKKIINAHEGKISVSSNKEHGSEFSIYIPDEEHRSWLFTHLHQPHDKDDKTPKQDSIFS